VIFLFQIATGWREYTIEKETFKTFPLSSEGRRKKKKNKKKSAKSFNIFNSRLENTSKCTI
jgi:hypothetical protein